jgi:hypothetical protein
VATSIHAANERVPAHSPRRRRTPDPLKMPRGRVRRRENSSLGLFPRPSRAVGSLPDTAASCPPESHAIDALFLPVWTIVIIGLIVYWVATMQKARPQIGTVLADCGPTPASAQYRTIYLYGSIVVAMTLFVMVGKVLEGAVRPRDFMALGPILGLGVILLLNRQHRLMGVEGIFWNGFVPWSQVRSWSRRYDGGLSLTIDAPRSKTWTFLVDPPWSEAASAVLSERFPLLSNRTA